MEKYEGFLYTLKNYSVNWHPPSQILKEEPPVQIIVTNCGCAITLIVAAHLKWAKKGLGNIRKKAKYWKKRKSSEKIEIQLEITHSLLVSNTWIKLLDFFHKVQWMEVFLFFKSKKKFSTFDEGLTLPSKPKCIYPITLRQKKMCYSGYF